MFYKYHAIPYRSKDNTKEDIYPIATEYVPQLIYAIEQQKDINDWFNNSDWVVGYQHLSHIQWSLLMGAKEDIIREIRDTRGSIPAGEPTDLSSYPVGTYPGIQLKDIVGSLNTDGQSAAFILAQIKTILESQGTNSEDSLGALLQIVALLSA